MEWIRDSDAKPVMPRRRTDFRPKTSTTTKGMVLKFSSGTFPNLPQSHFSTSLHFCVHPEGEHKWTHPTFKTLCVGFSEFIATRGFQRKRLCASVSLWWFVVPFLGSSFQPSLRQGVFHQISARMQVELLHEAGLIGFHTLNTDIELRCHLPIRMPARQ